MKKLTAMAMILTMVLGLAACGDKGSSTDAGSTGKTQATTAEATTEAATTAEATTEAATTAEPTTEATTAKGGVPDSFAGMAAKDETWGIDNLENPDSSAYWANIVPVEDQTGHEFLRSSISNKKEIDGWETKNVILIEVTKSEYSTAQEYMDKSVGLDKVSQGEQTTVKHGGVDCVEMPINAKYGPSLKMNDVGYWGAFEKDGTVFGYYYEVNKLADEAIVETEFTDVIKKIVVF